MEKRDEYVPVCHSPRPIERENRGNATRKLPLPNLPGGALIFVFIRRREDQGSHRQTIASTTQRTAHDAGPRRKIDAKRAYSGAWRGRVRGLGRTVGRLGNKWQFLAGLFAFQRPLKCNNVSIASQPASGAAHIIVHNAEKVRANCAIGGETRQENPAIPKSTKTAAGGGSRGRSRLQQGRSAAVAVAAEVAVHREAAVGEDGGQRRWRRRKRRAGWRG